MDNIEQDLIRWKTSRRKFLRAALVTGAVTQIPLFTSCSNITELKNDIFSAEEMTALKIILEEIWPNDGNGPSIDELNALQYILWVLEDKDKLQWSNEQIIKGVSWSMELSREKMNAEVFDLAQKERKELMKYIVEDSFGEKWVSILITHIYEALILDPIYGAQPNEAGWTWLGHIPGSPRPEETNKYQSLKTELRYEV